MKVNFYLPLIFIFSFFQLSAQDEDILSAYEDYSEMQREVVYLHLNKSTYIKGESIGLQAYVLDKASKRLSTETTNLYCVVSDMNNTVVKKKLLMVTNGIAINDFAVDSLFSSGVYKIAAYTNWMKNFEEKNFSIQKVRIIDPAIENEAKPLETSSTVDAQFLPEGGHLVEGVDTVIGVIIKDGNGQGIPDIECSVIDTENNKITSFTVNDFGIGRFNLNPQSNQSYRVSMKIDEKDHVFKIEDIASQGLGLSVNRLKDKTAITIKTNAATLDALQDKIYTIAIHNGDQLKMINFRFKEEMEIIKAFSNADLFPGINIITVFDQKNTPILERQIFNFKGLPIATSNHPQIEKKGDSLFVSIPYESLDLTKFNNFSISVLPSETRAYNHHENIASATWLQPYVKSFIENSKYYFTSITAKKEYQLDNLLLTQGWSSYNWDSVFNNPPDYDYDFENGISYVANFTDSKNQQLIVYPTLNSPLEIIELNPGEMAFEKQGFFPISDEKIEIGAIDKKGKPAKPSLFLKFSPEMIPEFKEIYDYMVLQPRVPRSIEMTNYRDFENGWKKIEQLDEVKLKAQRKYTKLERLRNATTGKIEFFDDKKKLKWQSVGRYLGTRGFVVLENKAGGNGFEIYRRYSATGRGTRAGDNIPVVYIDDLILHGDLSILRDMRLDDIESIEVNYSGIGAGMRGGGGVIKIKTSPLNTYDVPKKTIDHKSFQVPLKFDVAKRFYIPKYESYKSLFFKEYGVVDWFSNVSTDEKGVLKLKLFNNEETNLKLFIEGISSDGTYISEIKELNTN